MSWDIWNSSTPKAVEGTVVSASPGPSLAADGLPVIWWGMRRKPFLLFSPLQLRGGGNWVHLFSASGTRETRYTHKDLPPAPLLVAPCSGPLCQDSARAQSLTHIPGLVCLLEAPAAALLRRGRWVTLQVEKRQDVFKLLSFQNPHSSCLKLLIYFCIPRYSINMTEYVPPFLPHIPFEAASINYNALGS